MLPKIITSLTLQLREKDKGINKLKQILKGNSNWELMVISLFNILLDVVLIPRDFIALIDESLGETQSHPKHKKESKPYDDYTDYKLYSVSSSVESLQVSESKEELKSLVDDKNNESLSHQCKLIIHKTNNSMLDVIIRTNKLTSNKYYGYR